ncbi:hypothetical protein Bhyg_03123, partial [Pseudolycoriella hygida]
MAAKSRNWSERDAEQRELEKMFEDGHIDGSEPPNQIRLGSPTLMAFSNRVFAAHYRRTKAKYGAFEVPIDNKSKVIFNNPPCLTWIYSDHEQKCDIVCVAVPVIGGSGDIQFSISEDGMKVFIDYIWPSAIFSSALFQSKNLPTNHPKIHAFQSKLLQ